MIEPRTLRRTSVSGKEGRVVGKYICTLQLSFRSVFLIAMGFLDRAARQMDAAMKAMSVPLTAYIKATSSTNLCRAEGVSALPWSEAPYSYICNLPCITWHTLCLGILSTAARLWAFFHPWSVFHELLTLHHTTTLLTADQSGCLL